MPKYTFACQNGHSKQSYQSRNTKTIECETCGASMERQVPKLCGSSEVLEKEGLFNTAKQKDHNKIVNDRAKRYYWKHEVPKMVSSGVYTMETMLENGWIYYDEKGKLQTRTSPPESE